LLSPALVKRGDATCGLCQLTHPPFEKLVAYGSYDGGLRDLIHLLKYQQVRPAAAVLGRMLMEAIAGLEGEFPAAGVSVVPVPLHEKKQRQRGFNQSELIARAALKNLARPDRFRLLPAALARTRETASEIGLTRHQRRENLRGAFKVVDAHAVIDREILLVDDVFTTGTTASECSRLLRRAGAKKVSVVTVARTLKVSSIFVAREQDLGEAKEGRLAAAANG